MERTETETERPLVNFGQLALKHKRRRSASCSRKIQIEREREDETSKKPDVQGRCMKVEAENQCEDLKKPALPTVSVGKYAYAPTPPSLPSSSFFSPDSD